VVIVKKKRSSFIDGCTGINARRCFWAVQYITQL